MSHVPGGLVAKRFLNAWRPVAAPAPPVGGFTLFSGYTPFPAGVVTGPAMDSRDEFLTFVTVDGPQGMEEPDWEIGFGANVQAIVSNGNSANANAGAVVSGNVAGRFNTTPGGAQFFEVPVLSSLLLTFVGNMAGFGCFITDAGDFNTAWYARVTDENDVVTDYPISVGNESSGNLRFWGFTDGSGLLYKSVEIRTDDVLGDLCGVDDIHIINASQIA